MNGESSFGHTERKKVPVTAKVPVIGTSPVPVLLPISVFR